METKDAYNKLAKKYSLPDFDELDADFELSYIDDHEDCFLKEVRKKIVEKIDSYVKILEPILQPDTNMIDLHEIKEFNKSEIESLYNLYKKLMYFSRSAILAQVSCDEKLDADFIKEFYGRYKDIKAVMIETIKTLKDSWEKDADKDEVVGYLG